MSSVFRRPRRRPHCPPAVLLTVTALLAAAGCSLTTGAGTRPVPEPSPEAAKLCRALQKELPGTVDGLERNTGGPPSEFAAEWGDPAVQLRCGVPRPEVLTPGGEHYNPTAEGVEVNGVLWLPEKQEDGYRFTTTLRKAYVEVTVPGTYQPELNALTDLADAVESTIPNEL